MQLFLRDLLMPIRVLATAFVLLALMGIAAFGGYWFHRSTAVTVGGSSIPAATSQMVPAVQAGTPEVTPPQPAPTPAVTEPPPAAQPAPVTEPAEAPDPNEPADDND